MREAPTRARVVLAAARRGGRVLAVLVSAMRVLALVVAVNCTGFIHAAHDFADALAGFGHVDEDCASGEDPSHDCPPGCPSCHGASGFVRALPASVDNVELIAPPADEVPPWFVELGAPRRTHRCSVYRPPRFTGLVLT